MLAVSMLCLATIPVLVIAIVVWHTTGVPSMACATFVGASALAVNLYFCFEPGGDGAGNVLKWWFASAGAAWLFAFCALKLARSVDNGTLAWAVNTGCIAFFTALHAITEVPFTADGLSWLAYNLVVFIPMLFASLVLSSSANDSPTWLPLFFASLGLLQDAWKVTNELTRLVENSTAAMFVRFVTLGLVGAGVVAAGLAYHQHQALVADSIETIADKMCHRCRKKHGDGVKAKGEATATASPAQDSTTVPDEYWLRSPEFSSPVRNCTNDASAGSALSEMHAAAVGAGGGSMFL